MIWIELFLHFQVHCLLQKVQHWHFIPKIMCRQRESFVGSKVLARTHCVPSEAFPFACPGVLLCDSFLYDWNEANSFVRVKKPRWGTRFVKKHIFQAYISPIASEEKCNTIDDLFFWNFILLWKPLFKKSVLGYTHTAGKRVRAFCFLLPLIAYFSVI